MFQGYLKTVDSVLGFVMLVQINQQSVCLDIVGHLKVQDSYQVDCKAKSKEKL